jgi:metal-sulfur cluster biosynthetic enzyme
METPSTHAAGHASAPVANTAAAAAAQDTNPAGEAPVTDGKIWEILKTCYDPEIPLNIVDLGLVYEVSIKGRTVDVRMTLTAPGCPMAGQIAGEVQTKILGLENVEEVNVNLVWEPPWNQNMITEAGKLDLGLL